jgi:hypothetical protein
MSTYGANGLEVGGVGNKQDDYSLYPIVFLLRSRSILITILSYHLTALAVI